MVAELYSNLLFLGMDMNNFLDRRGLVNIPKIFGFGPFAGECKAVLARNSNRPHLLLSTHQIMFVRTQGGAEG